MPDEVSEATFAAFREHLDITLLKDPPIMFRRALLCWNAAREQVPGWPNIAVSVPARTVASTLPWSAFPESLQQDVTCYLDRIGGRDPLEELPFRPVRPLTLKHREYQIRQFASALMMRGREPVSLNSLADLVAIDAFKSGLRYLLERRGGRSTSTVVLMATSLKAIARHHVGVHEQHLNRMAAVISRLDSSERGLKSKNRARLRALDDPKAALALLQLPAKLMTLADREQRPWRAARLAQTAVAIEILLMAPIRLSNLHALDVERHFVRPSLNGKMMHVVIDASEVKNREPLEYPLPESSIELLELYLTRFRSTLTRRENTALFPGQGGAKATNTLRDQTSKAIFAHTGLHVHPHLFRHIAAKLYLDSHPGSYEIVRRVLGHRSIQTTTGFYTGCETAAAVRHLDATILKLRETGGRS